MRHCTSTSHTIYLSQVIHHRQEPTSPVVTTRNEPSKDVLALASRRKLATWESWLPRRSELTSARVSRGRDPTRMRILPR